MAALDQSLAIVEFDTSGTIITANATFCKTMGYDLPEVRGQHHSLFVDPRADAANLHCIAGVVRAGVHWLAAALDAHVAAC